MPCPTCGIIIKNRLHSNKDKDCKKCAANKRQQSNLERCVTEYKKIHKGIECKLCGKEFKRLGSHLRQAHNLNTEQQQDYYDECEKKEDEGICKECGAPTLFISLTKGYRQFCCPQCSNSNESKKQKSIETNLRKYGVKHAIQSKEIQEKIEKLT